MILYRSSINLISKIGYKKVYVGGGNNYVGGKTNASKISKVKTTKTTKYFKVATAPVTSYPAVVNNPYTTPKGSTAATYYKGVPQSTPSSPPVSKLVASKVIPAPVVSPIPTSEPGTPATTPQINQAYKYFDFATDVFPGAMAKEIIRPCWDNESEVLGTSGSLGTIHLSSVQSASSAASYYLNVYAKDPIASPTASVQFSISHGHLKGSGSTSQSGQSPGNTPSRAIYNQLTTNLSTFQADNEFADQYGAFFKWNGANGEENGFTGAMVLSLSRDKYRDGIDTKTFELHLSSSRLEAAAEKGPKLKLVIDDTVDYGGNTAGGVRQYPIRSGSVSTNQNDPVNSQHANSAFGFAYPDMGLIVLDTKGLNLSCSAQFFYGTGMNDVVDNKEYGMTTHLFNHIRDANYFRCNSREEVLSNFYYCRANNGEFNFSNNPSFSTGSNATATFRHSNTSVANGHMIGNPVVYLTTVGLYNEYNELLAVGKVSKPIKKSFDREVLIRLKLDN